jgi:hypothetical protein
MFKWKREKNASGHWSHPRRKQTRERKRSFQRPRRDTNGRARTIKCVTPLEMLSLETGASLVSRNFFYLENLALLATSNSGYASSLVPNNSFKAL